MHIRNTTMEHVDADEVKFAEVSKHPVGIIILYVQAAFGVFLATGLGYFLLPTVIEDTDQAFEIANIFAAVSILLAFIVVVIATIIYKENRLIITDRNITQILQYGIFSRKVSQLNLNNVEDVTAVQNGILPTTFNYGTLKIETAGEQMNFHFTFCPNAGYYAKIILDTREKMLGQTNHNPHIAHATAPTKAEISPQSSAIKDLGSKTIKQAISKTDS